jgi:hypothetical protein
MLATLSRSSRRSQMKSTAPLVLQELGALEALGQLHAHGVLDHARAGKADQGLGLGDHDVAHEGKAGRHAAHGRVGQHADVGQALLGQAGQGGIGLGHLHQANRPSCMRAPPVAVKQMKGTSARWRFARRAQSARPPRSPWSRP